MRASSTALGRGANQRSGFHSPASSPQISLFLFAFMMAIMTIVPVGRNTSESERPSSPMTGLLKGRTTSLRALGVMLAVVANEKDWRTFA